MARLIGLGLIASFFFSSTFVVNEAIRLEGGHWVWTASLRFGYMLLLLGSWIALRFGFSVITQIFKTFLSYWMFWLFTGTIWAGFYAFVCYASLHAPGWVIAATWQLTILATPIVLRVFFKKNVPSRGIFFSILIIIGVVLINFEQLQTSKFKEVLAGAIPVLIAAFAFPIGNQLVGEAKAGTGKKIPHIKDPVMENTPARILLMTMGSVPLWIVLALLFRPPLPTEGQFMKTAIIALSSGVVATYIFLSARHSTNEPYKIAAVDATQAGETIFSLMGGILFLHTALPHPLSIFGLLCIVLGIVLYVMRQPAGTLNQ